MKFGPTVAVFRGEAGLTFDDAAELSGMSLLWRAFLSWLRDLAGKREKPR